LGFVEPQKCGLVVYPWAPDSKIVGSTPGHSSFS